MSQIHLLQYLIIKHVLWLLIIIKMINKNDPKPVQQTIFRSHSKHFDEPH